MKYGFIVVKNKMRVGDDKGKIIMNDLKYLTTWSVMKSSFQPYFSLRIDWPVSSGASVP